MAMINGREPAIPSEHGDLPARVVVKFAVGPDMRQGTEETAAGTGQRIAGDAWSRLLDRFGEARFRRYAEDVGVPSGSEEPTTAGALERYLVAEVQARDRAEALAAELEALPQVEIAYVEAGPVPPPVNPLNDPRSSNQRYLNAAPTGIDARWAWGLVDGQGVGFVDLERGWTLNHEDLGGASITLISGINQDFPGHGTAVLGEVVAVDNNRGGIGIAPRAQARVVSQWRTATTYSTAAAITSAVSAMSRGDVLLLEAQTTVGTQSKVPVEAEQAVFDAISAAVAAGLVVVEAAGNGGLELDAVTDPAGRRVFDPGSHDYRDSGAIIVGAASSSTPHSRLSFSNYGSRVDCYGWGESIETSGDGWMGTSTTAYTNGFGGTSGASPIVAGAAVLLQEWASTYLNTRYSPVAVRDLLSRTSLNTPSKTPSSDRIGVMPNLRAIIENEQRRHWFGPDRWRIIIAILFGIIEDGGGRGLGPRGPIPVGPWGPLSHLSAAKRDILTGMAISELSKLINHPDSRQAVDAEGQRVIQAASQRLGEPET